MTARKIIPLLLVAFLVIMTPLMAVSAGQCDQGPAGRNCVLPYKTFIPILLNSAPGYEIKFIGNWSAADKLAAMQGVHAVGLALSRHSARSPQDTFNCIFGETSFYSYGVRDGYSAMASDQNLFFIPGLITPRLVVHELGHLFDNHTLGGTPPPEMLRETGVYAPDGAKVTGTKYNGYYLRNMGMRSPDNGYWSDDVRDEYQEHPISMEAGNNEFEDFADIWLNWVYGSFVPNQAGRALFTWTDKNMDTWLSKCSR